MQPPPHCNPPFLNESFQRPEHLLVLQGVRGEWVSFHEGWYCLCPVLCSHGSAYTLNRSSKGHRFPMRALVVQTGCAEARKAVVAAASLATWPYWQTCRCSCGISGCTMDSFRVGLQARTGLGRTVLHFTYAHHSSHREPYIHSSKTRIVNPTSI